MDKLLRANGGCLGIGRRRRTWQAAISFGESLTGFDPEISSGGGNSAWDRGTDHSTIPNFKTFQVGLNVGF